MKSWKKLGALEQRVALLCAILFVAFILLFSKLPDKIAAMEQQRKRAGEVYEFTDLFLEIYSEIRDRYVEEVDGRQLFEGAIRGMFATLDDHSQWLSPDSLQDLEKDTEGEFSGVGLQINLDQFKRLTVITTMPGAPAVRAGVRSWDRIMEIDGESTKGITLIEAVKKLTGPEGSEVEVTILRPGRGEEKLHIKIVRSRVKIESVFYRLIDEDIGYLRLSRFSDDTPRDVKEALEHFNDEGVEGFIIDLRFNTGGLLDKVIEICDFLLPEDQVIVSTKGRIRESDRTYRAIQDPITDLPLVVLVNRFSASASEILAGAVQDTRRGFIIGPEGKTTFGKGSVQTITSLRNSLDQDGEGEPMLSGMRLTTAHYLTPSGRSIQKDNGILPDLFVTDLTPDQEFELNRRGMLLGDPDQLESTEEEAEDGESDATLERDIQLDETIKYLRMTLLVKNLMEAS